MNLLLRMLWTMLFSKSRGAVDAMGPCRTPFRCWPTDLDVLRHMNNGKYFSIMDLARVDLMTRSGLLPKLQAKGWYPVVVAESMRFRKSIDLFARFDVETVVLGWDDKAILVGQKFLKGDAIVAEAVVRARFLKKTGGSVLPPEIMALAGLTGPSPALPEWIRAWNENQLA